MSTAVSPSKEYAVKVIEIGWVTSATPLVIHVGGDQPTIYGTFEDADDARRRVAENYIRLGLPNVAADVQVMSRQVVVTRDEWALG